MSTKEQQIRNWLMTQPGLVIAHSPSETMRKAWAMSGIEVSVGDFTDSLWRAGFRPEQVGTHWQLALPSKPVGGADWERISRMNNLAG